VPQNRDETAQTYQQILLCILMPFKRESRFMSLRQSLHTDSSTRSSTAKASASGKSSQSNRDLYEFLPRTGVRSNPKSGVVEKAFTGPAVLLEQDYAEPLSIFPPQLRSTAKKMTRAELAKRQTLIQRSIMAFALTLLILCGAYAGYLYQKSSAVKKYAGALLTAQTVQAAFPGVTGVNLVVIGRDYDYNNQDQVIKTHARSDMLMVAHVDFNGKVVHLLSIPRDTAAEIPGHGINKINSAHAFGGPALTQATITQNYGINTDHYIALDFSGFQQAIDQLGGVDCMVDKKMDYDDNWGNLHIHLRPGFQHLTGAQAMGFVRFRHSDSDVIRTHRQQALLAAIKLKLMQPQTLALLPALLDTIDRHVNTNLTPDQTVALAGFIHNLPDGGLQMLTMPTATHGQVTRTDYANAQPIVTTWFGATIPAKAVRLVESHKHRVMRHVVMVASSPALMPTHAKLTD
jgi:LCP family protein required for cell wall assembly